MRGNLCRYGAAKKKLFNSGHRTQEIEIHYRFGVAVTTAVADSMKYDEKRKAA